MCFGEQGATTNVRIGYSTVDRVHARPSIAAPRRSHVDGVRAASDLLDRVGVRDERRPVATFSYWNAASGRRCSCGRSPAEAGAARRTRRRSRRNRDRTPHDVRSLAQQRRCDGPHHRPQHGLHDGDRCADRAQLRRGDRRRHARPDSQRHGGDQGVPRRRPVGGVTGSGTGTGAGTVHDRSATDSAHVDGRARRFSERAGLAIRDLVAGDAARQCCTRSRSIVWPGCVR